MFAIVFFSFCLAFESTWRHSRGEKRRSGPQRGVHSPPAAATHGLRDEAILKREVPGGRRLRLLLSPPRSSSRMCWGRLCGFNSPHRVEDVPAAACISPGTSSSLSSQQQQTPDTTAAGELYLRTTLWRPFDLPAGDSRVLSEQMYSAQSDHEYGATLTAAASLDVTSAHSVPLSQGSSSILPAASRAATTAAKSRGTGSAAAAKAKAATVLLLLLGAAAAAAVARSAAAAGTPAAAGAVAKKQPAAIERAAAATVEGAAAAAARKVQYLERLEADSDQLVSLLRTSKAAQALENMQVAVSAARKQEQQIRRYREQQQQQQEVEVAEVLKRSECLQEWHLQAVSQVYVLLEATRGHLAAAEEAAKEKRALLSKLAQQLQQLQQAAAAAVGDPESSLLKVHALACRLNAEAAGRQRAGLHAAGSDLKAWLRQHGEPYATAAAPPDLLLQEAVAAAQTAAEVTSRVDTLLEEGIGWLSDGEVAAVVMSRSTAHRLQIAMAQLEETMAVSRFAVEGSSLPVSVTPPIQRLLAAAASVQKSSSKLAALEVRLRETHDPQEALQRAAEAKQLLEAAAAEVAAVPGLQLLPRFTAEDPLRGKRPREEATGKFVVETEDGGEPLELPQQEEDEMATSSRTEQLRAALHAISSAAADGSMWKEMGTVDMDTSRRLATLQPGTFGGDPQTPSRQLYRQWKEAVSAVARSAYDARTAVFAVQTAGSQYGIHRAATEALCRADEVVRMSAAAARQVTDCKSWLKIERNLGAALASHAKAVATLHALPQEEQQQQQHLLLPGARAADELGAKAEAVLEKKDPLAAARVAAEIWENTRQVELLVKERQAADRWTTEPLTEYTTTQDLRLQEFVRQQQQQQKEQQLQQKPHRRRH
ncbi:hypothetical protein Efla_001498 [Eimeria flavescens]